MRSFFEVWRRHLWLWVLPLGFCVLNLIAYSVYQSVFAGKVERLERRYQQAAEQIVTIEEERQLVSQFLEKIESHQAQVKGLYSERFQTEPQRFTRVLQEIKSLAEDSGLEPSNLSYPRQVYGEHGVVQRSIQFSVKGRYEQLRKFINFLELTDHFIALKSVTLGDAEGRDMLSINLVLSTFFSSRAVSSPGIAASGAAERDAVAPAGAPSGEEPST